VPAEAGDGAVKANEVCLATVREYIEEKKRQGEAVREIQCDVLFSTPTNGLPAGAGSEARTSFISREDTFVELGNPSVGSCAFLVWTHCLSAVRAGRITAIGPDIQDSEGQSLPFGQVVIVGGGELKEEHYPDLQRTLYAVDQPEGYMLRSVPRRVWSRVGKEAAARGFSFETLGLAIMSTFRRKHPLVQAVEILFVTAGKEHVEQLDGIAAVMRSFGGGLSKLRRQDDGVYECAVYNCSACDQKTVCDAIRKWITLRRGAGSLDAQGSLRLADAER